MFRIIQADQKTKARLGQVTTDHGVIQSPFFMPVGTNASVKCLTFEELLDFETQIVLSNTYHLYLRPGLEVIEAAGGLHGFMGWRKPILTDSGGYQVFSLTKLRKIKGDGVEFQSHLDGSRHFFTPEKVVDIERTLGSDMIMPLDVCAPYPCQREEAEDSVRLTSEWARRSKDHFTKQKTLNSKQFLFGICQGATYKDLREQSVKDIVALDLDGYAVGGVSVGEPVKDMFESVKWVEPYLPKEKPRYLMGIGLPDQIVKAVGEGIDMFDTCVPTRYGRHGTAFTRKGPIALGQSQYIKDFAPLDAHGPTAVSRAYSRSYIRHLLNQNELTALKIISYHNVAFYVNLMKEIREAIRANRYQEFQDIFLKEYRSELQPSGV